MDRTDNLVLLVCQLCPGATGSKATFYSFGPFGSSDYIRAGHLAQGQKLSKLSTLPAVKQCQIKIVQLYL